MNRHLEHYKLGTLCSVKHGYPFDGSKFADHGTYIVLTPGNFFEKGGFKRIKGKEKYYTGAFPQEYLCSKDDLIVAMTQQAEGLLGSTALVPEDNLYLHNQRIGLVFHNHDLVDKLYLYYLFMTKSVRKQISDSASGTKIKHTSPDKIYSVSVSIPSIDIQRKNALLLYWIDKKIENNAIAFNYGQASDLMKKVRDSIEREQLSDEDRESAMELISEAETKIAEQKKPRIIQAALSGLRDFLVAGGANVTAALVVQYLQTL
jgi:type I restriction enzyme S subunit